MRLGVLAAATAVALFAGAAMANPGLDARKELMKSIVDDVKAISGYLKGQNQETPADVARRAGAIEVNAAKIEDAFGDEIHVENAEGLETRALPGIWKDWDKFVDLANDLETKAGELAVTAAAGDKAAIADSFGAMAKACGACHTPFRAEKK